MQDAANLLITILSFLAAMSVVIVIHELGHLLAARAMGIRTEKFSIGFGPSRVFHTDKHGTRWVISAIPMGGYVTFPNEGNDTGKALRTSPVISKIIVVLAGPFANFLLASVLFAIAAGITGKASDDMIVGEVFESPPGWEASLEEGDRIIAINDEAVEAWADITGPSVPQEGPVTWTVERDGQVLETVGESPYGSRVWSVMPGFPADIAGISQGDVVIAVNGNPIMTTPGLKREIRGMEGRQVVLTVWREGEGEREVVVTPRMSAMMGEDGMSETAQVGVSTMNGSISPFREGLGIGEAALAGMSRTAQVIEASFRGMSAMAMGTIGTCNMGGAISMAETSSAAAMAGPMTFMIWIAALSTAIGFFNLLPIPALDGGHALNFAYEGVRGKPPSDKVLSMMAFVGTSAIIFLMIFGVTMDMIC